MASRPQLPELDSRRCRAEEILAAFLDAFPGRVSLACSFQKEESVLLDMLLELDPKARVFALDTHVLFPETYAVWREVERRYGTKVEVYEGPSLGRQAAAHGDELWERNPTLCCSIRKVEPLARALDGLDAWITGLRRDQSPTRADAPKVGWDERTSSGRRTRSPTGTTSAAGPTSTSASCPYNALHDRGYAVDRLHALHAAGRAPGEDERRAAGPARDKIECGIHVHTAIAARRSEPASSSGSRASRPPASRRSPGSSRPSSRSAASLVDRLDGDVVREHLSKDLGFSKEDRDTNIEPHRLGRLAARARRRGRRRLGDLALRGGARSGRARSPRSTPLRRGPRRDVARGVRAPRPQGPLREGVRGRDRRVHRRLRPVRGAVESRSCALETEGRTPEESARVVLAQLEELGLVGRRCGVTRHRRAVHALAPRRARGRGDPHHARGRRRARAARAALLRRQGLDRAAAARREGVPPGQVPVPGHARRHRPQLPRGDRVPRPPRRRARRAARRRERPGVDRQGPRRRADRARARRATSCRRRRCSTRSRSTASTRRWAAPAATRSGPARRSASSASATTSASGTRARSGPSSGTSTTAASARASRSASSRSRTGPSSTSGSTSRASSSSCRRSTSRTSATSSAATG